MRGRTHLLAAVLGMGETTVDRLDAHSLGRLGGTSRAHAIRVSTPAETGPVIALDAMLPDRLRGRLCSAMLLLGVAALAARAVGLPA